MSNILQGPQGVLARASMEYARHRPEQTLLYQVIEEYYLSFLSHLSESEKTLPQYVHHHAERQLRPLVISKKLTFGTQSERGSRFIERIFSIVATCKQQNYDILDFIMKAIQGYFTPLVLHEA